MFNNTNRVTLNFSRLLKMNTYTSISHKLLTETIVDAAINLINKTLFQILPFTTNILYRSESSDDEKVDGNAITIRAKLNAQKLINLMKTTSEVIIFGEVLSRWINQNFIKNLNRTQLMKTNKVIEDVMNATLSMYIQVLDYCNVELIKNESNNYVIVMTDEQYNIRKIIPDQFIEIFSKPIKLFVEENVNKCLEISEPLETLSPYNDHEINTLSLISALSLLVGIPLLSISSNTNMYPILLIMGICSIAWYYISSEKEISYRKFSSLIFNTESCNTYRIDATTDSLDMASKTCLENDNCEAFDFTTNLQGSKYQVRYYTDIPTTCKILSNPTSFFINKRDFTSSNIDPVPTPLIKLGSIHINTTNSKIYEFDDTKTWSSAVKLLDEDNFNLIVSRAPPTTNNVGLNNPETRYYLHVPDDLSKYYLYKILENKWTLQKTITGPNPYKIHVPDTASTVGIKIIRKNDWFLYIGISAFLIGIVGNVQFKSNR